MPMIDKRLLGTWKSDKAKTLAEMRLRRDFKSKQLKVLAPMLGKLEVRYTRTKCHVKLGKYRDSRQYTVLGKDSEGVAILSGSSLCGEDQITHIRFDGRHYWITVRGCYREWFKKVPAPSAMVKSGKKRVPRK
jgi:hypothetical protein